MAFHAEAKAKPKPVQPMETVWVAQFDFADPDDDEVLSITEGDVLINVLAAEKLPGWATATLEATGQGGFVPQDYINEVRRVMAFGAIDTAAAAAAQVYAPAARVAAQQGRSGLASTPELDLEKCDFVVNEQPELELAAGDFVTNELPELAVEEGDFVDYAPERAGGADSIKRAWYGDPAQEWFAHGHHGMDVTAQAKAAVVDGKLRIVVSNAIGGDPKPGCRKVLVVEYRHESGDNETETANEGQLFCAELWNWVSG
jgi:hypothetical protein